jgi:uncharacterized membrane protein
LAVLGLIVASLLLLVSALWLPWATYRHVGMTVSYRTSPLNTVLILCALLTLVLGVVSVVKVRRSIDRILLLASCVAVVSALALALTTIREANEAAERAAAGATQTSYGIGSALGLGAAVALLVICLSRRSLSRRSPTPLSGVATRR